MRGKTLKKFLVSLLAAGMVLIISIPGHPQVKDQKAGTGTPPVKEITVGFLDTLGEEKTEQKFEPLVKHLEKTMGVQIKMVTAHSSKLVAQMLFNKIDFAYMGPSNYIDAHKLGGAEAIAIELSPEGKPGYYSVLISAKKSGIKTLDQAKGKVFGFVDNDSASGFQVPTIYFLRERKQTLASFASRTEMAGSHIAVVQGVAKGTYDVGATNDMDLAKSCATLKINPNQFVILWKSDLIPGAPFVARKGLTPELKKSFLDALLGFNSNKAALKKMQIGGYIAAKDSDFDPYRELAKFKTPE